MDLEMLSSQLWMWISKKNVFKFSCDLAQWHEVIVPWEIHMDLIKIKSIKANLIKQIIKLS